MTTHRRRRLPHLPWFKDERVAGTGMSAAQTLRLFIVAVVGAVVVFAGVGFYLLSLSQKTDATARTAATFARQSRELVDQLKAIQARNHASRLEDQQRTDRELRQLACVIVSQVNEDDPQYPAGSRRAVKQFRAFYHCPPYSARSAANPFPAGALPAAAPRSTPQASTSTTAPSVHAAPAPHASAPPRSAQVSPSPTATSRTASTQPAPTRTPSASPTPSPIRSVVCTVLNVVGLCRTETP